MKFILVLFSLLVFTTTVFATESDKNLASKKLDSMDLDNFDNETDEEALQKLKKKASDKRKKKLEEKKEVKVEEKKNIEETDEKALEDLKKKASDRRTESDHKRMVGKNPYKTDQNKNNDEVLEKTEMGIITFGGGYDFGLNYPISNHVGLEFQYYFLPPGDNMFMHGIILGAGIVTLSYTELYFSLAYSLLVTPVKSNKGIFFRGDLGLMGLGYVSNEEDEDEDEDGHFKEAGILLKGGVGFMLGADAGITAQILYTSHITTMGNNNGLELQIGFYF